jgi:diguanylate cyclase (GGDEF)-like protein
VSEIDSAEPVTTVGGSDPPGAVSLPETLRRIIAERAADGSNLAVLLIESGIVGRIDAVWGYHVGDSVRERVQTLLRSEVLRPGDLVGEMGRDDFACILSTVADPAVALLAAKKSLRTLNTPFWIGDDEIYASPAIGIAMYPAHGDQPEILLQKAKGACALARERASRIADCGDDGSDAVASTLLYENRLRTAVAENTLDLVFQPQYDLRLGQIMGAEGLLCWSDEARALIASPDAFAAAESIEKIPELVSSILNRALRNVSEFRYSGGLDLRIGIKLPARALRNAELVEVVRRALGTWSRRPGTLILEIGETRVLAADERARQTLAQLKEIGLKLSIDDPDMSLSSLLTLATMPFQEIKIDVSAASDLSGMAKPGRIIQSFIELAHHLRLEVVAVGVADEAAAARLKELGCDHMQADFKGPAVGPREFVERFGFAED